MNTPYPRPTIFLAILRALISLLHPKILFHILWPMIIGIVLWVILFFWLWASLITPLFLPYTEEIVQHLPGWIVSIGLVSFFLGIAQVLLAFLLLPVIYLTFMMILSLFAIPLILPIIAKRYYPEVAHRGEATFARSLRNTLYASSFFLMLWLLSFLLFFVPGAIFIAHWLCIAYLNKATFTYDALSEHATVSELQHIQEKYGTSLMTLGGMVALLAYIPLLNLVIPAIAGLCFIHYSLMVLRYIRNEVPPENTPPIKALPKNLPES